MKAIACVMLACFASLCPFDYSHAELLDITSPTVYYQPSTKTEACTKIVVMKQTSGDLVTGLTKSKFSIVNTSSNATAGDISPNFNFSVKDMNSGVYSICISPTTSNWPSVNEFRYYTFLFRVTTKGSNGTFEMSLDCLSTE